ncbi:tyrosine-type recombinase/integrase [Aeromonas sp. sia0103]|uniref:phage integrase n=1 Tax=Aeromonas sp. sia0103 TaxID=2854782 RepID=UPI001C472531|nr:tyrosine-type recombinase/integrase [Aeromonas sp. sia0103]MBV7598008.1 tyrosine-type recombinase/integrase [Aeromonas sp. sia0103]
MTIKKLDDGRYEVDVRPQGRNGKRVRRKFDKKHEATAFERYVLANQHDKAWLDKPKDARPLAELIRLWWAYHGQHAKWGERNKLVLERMDQELGSLRACELDELHIAAYRTQRLMAGCKASTVNREVTCLSGMFTFLINAKLYQEENRVGRVGKLKTVPTAMSYLTLVEIHTLLASLTGDDLKIVVFCLNTGARWSEAAELRAEHVINQRAMFVETKNGRSRVVPLSAEVEQFISGVDKGLLFPDADYTQIRLAIKAAKPQIPKGQALHILRHTYATHFMINGGNIIALQRILGHASIQQTMTYAHFAPDYLQDAVALNPLRGGVGVHPTRQCTS